MSYSAVLRQDIQAIDWTDIDVLLDDFTNITKTKMQSGKLKKQAALYLGFTHLDYLDRKSVKKLSGKKKKLRRSIRKTERAKSHALVKQINWYLEFRCK